VAEIATVTLVYFFDECDFEATRGGTAETWPLPTLLAAHMALE
jgi:hypothetical protein